jgi:hypothetical protein
VVVALSAGSSLPTDHPAFGKGLVNGKPAAYVCVGPVCSLPVTDPRDLIGRLTTTASPINPVL